MSKLERCCKCDSATGKAGAGDDSLYTESDGPFCEDCFADLAAPSAASDAPDGAVIDYGTLPPLPNPDGEIAKVRYWNISAMKDYARAAISASQAAPAVNAQLVAALQACAEFLYDTGFEGSDECQAARAALAAAGVAHLPQAKDGA